MIGVIVYRAIQPDLPLSEDEPEPASASSIRFDSILFDYIPSGLRMTFYYFSVRTSVVKGALR